MKRDIYKKLQAWKIHKHRKPLLLMGARQVGKTYILNEFAKEYKNCIYINFEKMTNLSSYFEKDLSPEKIIEKLQIHFSESILPEKTLLIFDEVQECPGALVSLKYFKEEANEYHVVAAGSLLGVKLKATRGFPVGKVNFLHLKPLSFFEFLSAIGEGRLRKYFEKINNCEPLEEPLHQKAIGLLRQYFIIGGMPEVVAAYIEEKNYERIREVQKAILDSYVIDFAKHANSSDVIKIMNIWESIPIHLAKENKKFVFSAISKSARAREYENALQWLVDAGLIYKSYNISSPKLPLIHYSDSGAFKVYMLDVGLLGCMSNLPVKAVLESHRLFVEFKGALTENYVAQELMVDQFESLYYWTSGGVAEIDFIFQHNLEIVPLEVKSGISARKKSLMVYAQKYNSKLLTRSTLMNLRKDGKIINYPLYLICRLLKII